MLNDGNIQLTTASLNKLISFDRQLGLIRCEAAVTLQDIIEFAGPRGWFLPVTLELNSLLLAALLQMMSTVKITTWPEPLAAL